MDKINRVIEMSKVYGGTVEFMLNGNQIIYNVTEKSLPNLISILNSDQSSNATGSDSELYEAIFNNISSIKPYDPGAYAFVDDSELSTKTYNKPRGGFCEFNHTLPFDFSRYGIFKPDEDVREYHKNNCLYHAFRVQGMSIVKLNSIKAMVFQRDISKIKLKEIAEKNDLHIILNYESKTIHYGNRDSELYRLALNKNHYFVYEETEYNSYVIENYEKIKNEKDYLQISRLGTNGYYIREKRGINSLKLFKLIEEHHSVKVKKMDLLDTVYHSKVEDRVKELEYLDKDVKIYSKKKEKSVKKVLRVFFDFETVALKLNEKELILRPRELCASYEDDGVVVDIYFEGYDCGKLFIEDIKKINSYNEIHLIAHNAKFDFNFIVQYLDNIELCKNDGIFIFAKSFCAHNNSTIIVKDSMKFMNCKLLDFEKMFNLKKQFGIEFSKKEFDFDLIKEENFDEKGMMIDEWFDAPLDINADIVDGKFNLRKYSRYYCEFDVKVLQKGYNIFGNWVSDLGLNIDQIYTSASLSKLYAENQGCFEETYELSGIPQTFINQAMYGGRVMTQENKMILKENCKIVTLDANSLYPSAMINIKGFLKGRPKVIPKSCLNMNFLNEQDYYYVDIKINKILKRRKMPLLCIKKEDNILYTDDIEEFKDIEITVGKTYLENLIKFQLIEFDVIRGYYFDDGFNDKIVKVINYLFEKRNELKKEGNSAQEIYKLIMNSIYGRCLMKPKTKKLVIKEKNEMLNYLIRNKTNIEMIEKIYESEKYCIREYKEINNDYNSVHIGCQILDESKNIMNKVITLAEDQDIDIYYTDTDSIHLDIENVHKLSKIYEILHQENIMHDNLGGFKMDLNKKEHGYIIDDIYAKNVIYLGKKVYYCQLNTDFDYARARGITKKALIHKSAEFNDSLMDVYKEKYYGRDVECDLTCGGKVFTPIQKFNFSFCDQIEFKRKL